MIARQVFYEGRVQGVGFRYTCKNIARGFDVVGSVRNLDDGRVELQCGGDAGEVEAFLAAIAESDLKAHIKHTTTLPLAPLVGARGFEITG
jgi:acylphosphatase